MACGDSGNDILMLRCGAGDAVAGVGVGTGGGRRPAPWRRPHPCSERGTPCPCSGANLALVVGNAQPDLVKWLEQHRGEASPVAGKQRLYRAAQHEAHGILEGLQYWGLK